MAEVSKRLPENVAGAFFVDDNCIDCDTCRCLGPRNFVRSDNGYSYVFKQPETEEEIEDVEDAIDCCPVSAIGKVED